MASKKLAKTGSVDSVTMMVKREDLKAAPWNPQIRVQIQYLRDLRASMEADGFWDFMPILADKNGVIIDGHRRWTVAKLLNIEDVPVTIVDDDADKIWSGINGTHMSLTGAQTLQAVSSGLKTRPPKFARLIAQLEDAIGEAGAKELGQRGISPGVMNVARRIARYCLLEDDREFMRLTVYWIVNNSRMSVVTARAINDGVDPNVIEKAVRGNKTLTTNYA